MPWARLAETIAAHMRPSCSRVERSYLPALEVLAVATARLLSLAGTAPAAAAA
jgi:hypothetical protein